MQSSPTDHLGDLEQVSWPPWALVFTTSNERFNGCTAVLLPLTITLKNSYNGNLYVIYILLQ